MLLEQDAEAIARHEMMLIAPDLVEQYGAVIRFLSEYPDCAAGGRGALALGSEGYIKARAHSFMKSRLPKRPQPPSTTPDSMVSVIMTEYFEIPADRVDDIAREHQLSMGAESVVGDLLERYLADVLEPRGWIWCSGSQVRAVDFIKPPAVSGGRWRLLQVKNRDNSENSSSSAIRNGTSIEKWHRTFSGDGRTNWSAFPDIGARPLLSEEGFEVYVRNYLRSLRSLSLTTVD